MPVVLQFRVGALFHYLNRSALPFFGRVAVVLWRLCYSHAMETRNALL